VLDIIADHVAHGYSAAQIVEQYPDLTPAQVHAALTYYYDYDHQNEMDAALSPKLVAARWRGRQANAAVIHGRACQCSHHGWGAAAGNRCSNGPGRRVPVLFRQDDDLLAIARTRQALRVFFAGLSYGY
jgi:hypothetical protein